MTAKEKLSKAVEGLSEAEAAAALDFLVRRQGQDTLDELLDAAPGDDEPESDEEATAVAEAREELDRGEAVSLGSSGRRSTTSVRPSSCDAAPASSGSREAIARWRRCFTGRRRTGDQALRAARSRGR